MQTIYIDISRKAVLPMISAKQGDVGRKFKVIFTDAGLPYYLSESHFSVFYSGESGEGNYTDIGGDSAFEISGNAATVELITQMLTNPGEGELCLVSTKSGGEQIGSWNIPYFVEVVPGAGSEAAQDYYTAFSNSAAVVAEAVSEASRSANSASDSAAKAAQSAKDAEDAALAAATGNPLVIGQGLNAKTLPDGKTELSVSNDISYNGSAIDKMEVGLRAYNGAGFEAVEFSHSQSGRNAFIGTRSSDDTSSMANVNAGIGMGTISSGNGNAITFFSNGKPVAYVNEQGAALYGNPNTGGKDPVISLSALAKMLQIGFSSGGNISIITGKDANTGSVGQVLTAQGDDSCVWAEPKGLMMHGGAPMGRELMESWAALQSRIKKGDFTGIHIGDWKEISMYSGETVIMEVAGIDQYYRCGDTQIGHHVDFISRDCLQNPYQFNSEETNNGTAEETNPFRASDLFMNLQNIIYNWLPEDLKPCIISKRMMLDYRYAASGAVNTPTGWGWGDMGKLWLPRETEVWGTTKFGDAGLGNGPDRQYPIFAGNSKHLIKGAGNGGSRCSWWLASARSGSADRICAVYDTGTANNLKATNASGYVPLCFRIG